MVSVEAVTLNAEYNMFAYVSFTFVWQVIFLNLYVLLSAE